MYRAVTLYSLQNGIMNAQTHELDVHKLVEVLPQIEVSFQFNSHSKTSETYLNGVNVERDIRTMQVSENVSKVSSIKEVREKMVALQRQMGRSKGVVMDGRDIGTHVFPNAELKLFMTADTTVRAQRRLDELSSKGQYFLLEEVKQNLLKRDYDDSHRKENPLIQAKDAIVLDNTDISREEQLEYVLRLIADLQLTTH